MENAAACSSPRRNQEIRADDAVLADVCCLQVLLVNNNNNSRSISSSSSSSSSIVVAVVTPCGYKVESSMQLIFYGHGITITIYHNVTIYY